MKDRLARLYREGRITQEQLHNAVGKFITEEEYEEIISSVQNMINSQI